MVLLSALRTHRYLREARHGGPSWLLATTTSASAQQTSALNNASSKRLKSSSGGDASSSGDQNVSSSSSQGRSNAAPPHAAKPPPPPQTLLKRIFGGLVGGKGRRGSAAAITLESEKKSINAESTMMSSPNRLVMPEDSSNTKAATLESLRAMNIGANLPDADASAASPGSTTTSSDRLRLKETLREVAKKRLEQRKERERHRQSITEEVSSVGQAESSTRHLNHQQSVPSSSAVEDVPEPPSHTAASSSDAQESHVGPSTEDLEEILASMRGMSTSESPSTTATSQEAGSQRLIVATGKVNATKLKIADVRPLREAKVARLRRGLDRVLFNPSVYFLRDPHSLVYNFDPSMEVIPRPEEFAFERLPAYVTASQDKELHALAKQHNLKYYGSTSTLTAALSQIYFSISGYRPVDTRNLSSHFAGERDDFTAGARLPASLWIRAMPHGKYAIDNEKSWDIEGENVLSELGNVMEKLLTTEPKEFRRFLRSSPDSAVPPAEREERQAYRYCKGSSLLMRSQLDCHDRRLPGRGTFDIKTRAAMVIRHDRANHAENSAYDIHQLVGTSESFEKEFYDMSRSAFLKYSMQVRIGGMDGIFVAYHNTARIFGFQYIPLKEMDRILHGSSEMGEQAFKHCVYLFEQILDQATAAFPGESINLIINSNENNNLTVTATPESSKSGSVGDAAPAAMFTLNHKNLLDGNRKSGVVGFDRSRADKTECEYFQRKSKRY